MSFLFGFPLSSGTAVAMLALSGKKTLVQGIIASAKGFARIPALSFGAKNFGGIVSTLIFLLTLICF